MRGSSTQTFKPNLLEKTFRNQFAAQGGGQGFVKALITRTDADGVACAEQPASLAGTVGVTPTQTSLRRAQT